MRRSGSFERRLLFALVLFSLVPTLMLVGAGALLLREAVSLQTTSAGWERLAESGRMLLEQAEESGDSTLVRAAEAHRRELTASVQQAQRWAYLGRRILAAIPGIATLFGLALAALALRSARRMAHELSRPIRELAGWSERVARGERLPAAREGDPAEGGEFGVLRTSFRRMQEEVEELRIHEVEAARIRGSMLLARGVAHELKNSLTPLKLAIRVLQRGEGREDRESLEVLEEESHRLESLARTFAQLGQPPTGERSTIDLGELLEQLLQRYLPEHLERAIELDPRVTPIRGYYEPLARALSNLLLNAAEAIGENRGTIAVRIRPAGADRIEIRVGDSGPGISAQDRARLWDPDFTTKARGTGIGLALVRQVIGAHGGQISVAGSSLGGAEFRIVLPRGVPASSEGAELPERVEAPALGSG